MLKRIVVGVIAAALAITVIAFRDTPAMPIVLAVLSCIATYEIEKCVQLKNKAIEVVSLVFSALVPLYYTYAGALAEAGLNLPTTAVVALYAILLFILMLANYEHTKFEDVAAVLVASIFVPWAFSSLALLSAIDTRFPEEFDGYHGLFFILFALFCALITDTFAYFTGKFLGKHKLTKISPKKTVEGAIGGVIGGILSSVILFAVLSVVGMCGDLTASVVKRNFGVKDFGKLFPGHGGVMDRCDSVLFVSSALYALILLTRTVF